MSENVIFTELCGLYLSMKNNPGDLEKRCAYFEALADARLTDFYRVYDENRQLKEQLKALPTPTPPTTPAES